MLLGGISVIMNGISPIMGPRNPGGVVISGKKRPLPGMPPGCRRNGFSQKSQISFLASSGTLNLKPIIVNFGKVSETEISMLF